MVKRMKNLFKKTFIDNWQRKLLALILAIITWVYVNKSLSVKKTISNIPIKIINLPKNKTIKGLQSDGLMPESVTLELIGNKNLLDKITKKDLRVVIDLKDKTDEVITTSLNKTNIISVNPNIDINKAIKHLPPKEVRIRLSNLVKEKIRLLVNDPIGAAPKHYKYLDAWPYELFTTVTGPEELIKKLKAQTLKLTFNLNAISEQDLDALEATRKRGKNDLVSFFVPSSWKQINIPSISPVPIPIDDETAKALRIDFQKNNFFPLNALVPIKLYFPLSTSDKLNPNTIKLATNEFIKKINDVDTLNIPIYVKDVSESFVKTIRDRLQIIILVEEIDNKINFSWSIQPVIFSTLKNLFIKSNLSENIDEPTGEPSASTSEEYFSYKFRAYTKSIKFCFFDEKKFNLKIKLENNQVVVTPDN